MKHLLSRALGILLILCIIGASAFAASSAQSPVSVGAVETVGETRNPDIINGNSYDRYNDVNRTYLCTTDNGFMRVYGNDDCTLLAEYYDSQFRFTGNRYVNCGLPLFGGFYESDSYYFVVTGNWNSEENNKKEVIRITRFDKNWNRNATASLYGANTTVPFDAGQCDFAAYGDHLVIRSCHEIYAIWDDYEETWINHQTNLTIVLNMKRMVIENSFTDISNVSYAGFLSHSFNQFVAVDTDGTVVCLDHGDAHPRAATLGRYKTKADSLVIYDGRNETYDYRPIIEYNGYEGDNITGGLIGGLECSSTSYITVGSTVEQNENYWTNHAFNAYYSVTGKSAADLAHATTRIVYLSAFTEEDNRYASNPHLVKIRTDLFLVMWNEFPVAEYLTLMERTYDETCVMKYLFIDGNGNPVTQILTAPAGSFAYATECEPIVRNNKIYWYVSDGRGVSKIIEMDLDGVITSHDDMIPDDIIQYPIRLADANIGFRSFEQIPASVQITEDNLEDYIVVSYNGLPLEYGWQYVLDYDDPNYPAISVTTSGGYIQSVTLNLMCIDGYSYFPTGTSFEVNWTATYRTDIYLNSVTRGDDGVTLDTVAFRGVGYEIYRREGTSGTAYTCIARIDNRLTRYYVDTTASPYKTYTYYVREFTYDAGGNAVYSAASKTRAIKALPEPEPTEPPTDPPTEPPTDPPTEPPTDPPTEPPTDPPTEPHTEPQTEPHTEPHTEPAGQTILLGDADKDGSVTVFDATFIQRYLVGLVAENDFDVVAANTDFDAGVSVFDATNIQRALVGMSTGYPIGQWVVPTTV